MKDRKSDYCPFSIKRLKILDISKFTVEDFVLNQDFKMWVYFPDQPTKHSWEKLLEENPDQIKCANAAKAILIDMNYLNSNLSKSESIEIWEKINKTTENSEAKSQEKGKLIFLNSDQMIRRYESRKRPFGWFNQELRVACILFFAFSFSFVFGHFTHKPIVVEEIVVMPVHEEYIAQAGVKSTLTLNDGSIIMLNSGSSIRFIKNFEIDKRVVYLEGEAFFEVAKDSLRPFSVITGEVTTTALGTSFNISAYPNEKLNVALVEGKVAIEVLKIPEYKVLLDQGEEFKINIASGRYQKGTFDPDLILAWTDKKIIFQKVKFKEAIRVLENWYGVNFTVQNYPSPDLELNGVFQDETLENVLEALSYTARFRYKLNKDEVKIVFN